MTPVVFWIWTATLVVVTVVIVPVALLLLHRTLRAARAIERYTRESLEAGQGIARHTAPVRALDDTIAVATSLLETSRSLARATGAIAATVRGKGSP